MGTTALGRYVLSFSLAALFLAACGGSQPAWSPPVPGPPLGGAPNARSLARSYERLFSFDHTDGGSPYAGLLNVNGTLYGTTYFGGTKGDGTVFAISRSGQETVLHSFVGGRDGASPNGSLVDVDGTLYGTTAVGGGCIRDSLGCGTVYSITTAGKERVLYNFPEHSDGKSPTGRLLNVQGTLYGTTAGGGRGGSGGTVFSITTAGKARVLCNFKGGDGNQPSPLVDVNGTLYGTMYAGGADGDQGYGTVFSVTLDGKARVIHDFTGPPDGAFPIGGLLGVNGTLYGTTSSGGASGCNSSGENCGTIYRITPAGKEQVLYRFAGGPTDGGNPNGQLLSVQGALYGTTMGGGTNGRGTVFAVTTAGKERVLYNFDTHHHHDGQAPLAGLISVKGRLYGTTSSGGNYHVGTVFALQP